MGIKTSGEKEGPLGPGEEVGAGRSRFVVTAGADRAERSSS